MENLFDFIVDNIWWIIAALVFLSGLKKSKKKKGDPVEQPKDVYDSEYDEYDEYDEQDWDENRRPSSSDLDDLPIPQTLKDILQKAEGYIEPKKESPWSEKPKPVNRDGKQSESIPTPQNQSPWEGTSRPAHHYDSPWSGQGKENPHGEVFPTNSVPMPYGGEGKMNPHSEVFPTNTIPMPYSGQGKVFPKMPVIPQNHSSSVAKMSPEDKMEAMDKFGKKIQSELEENRDAYAQEWAKPMSLSSAKLIEGIVLSEVLGKPKALRKAK